MHIVEGGLRHESARKYVMRSGLVSAVKRPVFEKYPDTILKQTVQPIHNHKNVIHQNNQNHLNQLSKALFSTSVREIGAIAVNKFLLIKQIKSKKEKK